MDKMNLFFKALACIILLVITLAIGAFGGNYLGIFKEDKVCETNENKKINSNEETKKYDYDSFSGLYLFTSKPFYSEANDGVVTPTYKLYLYDDGTFNYQLGYVISMGKVGNYIIKNNTIVLNYLFETSSDAALNVVSGEKVLSINGDNSLTDNNQEIPIVEDKSIILKKSSAEEEEEFLKNNMSVEEMINKYDVVKVSP